MPNPCKQIKQEFVLLVLILLCMAMAMRVSVPTLFALGADDLAVQQGVPTANNRQEAGDQQGVNAQQNADWLRQFSFTVRG